MIWNICLFTSRDPISWYIGVWLILAIFLYIGEIIIGILGEIINGIWARGGRRVTSSRFLVRVCH